MRFDLEITFMDGTKSIHKAEIWDEFKFRPDGILQIEYQGSAIAWYPIQNIKAMIAVSEDKEE